MHSETWIDEDLAELREKSLERRLSVFCEAGGKIKIDGRTFLNFSSNDYLGLARHPEVISLSREYLESYGCGATASRLITGTLDPHCHLERVIAALKGYPEALVFGSGFLANAGVITSIVGRSDHVFADKLAHASIIDGIVLEPRQPEALPPQRYGPSQDAARTVPCRRPQTRCHRVCLQHGRRYRPVARNNLRRRRTRRDGNGGRSTRDGGFRPARKRFDQGIWPGGQGQRINGHA